MSEQQCDIGVIGLGVMGKNLALNLADNGYQIACFDLSAERIDAAVSQDAKEQGNNPKRLHPCTGLADVLSRLSSPRKLLLSVPAGKPVDAICEELIKLGIQQDDIVIDTGNSLWTDSVEREAKFSPSFSFFSCAVSGGEVGARTGPSLMPSGDAKAWPLIEPILHAIAAKVDSESGLPLESKPGAPAQGGEPCAAYMGPAGAGHYVKMVHNGIEYADMQLICEAYHILRNGLDYSPVEIADFFETWNQGLLNSYLMDISIDILRQEDPQTGAPIVDVILDKAGQKGTGLWTAVGALQSGVPAQTITQAVFARSISSLKNERVEAANVLPGPEHVVLSDDERKAAVIELQDALYCSKICAYAQGFQLMDAAAKEQGWDLDFGAIAKIWRAGCIIRAVFLQSIADAYSNAPTLPNLLLDPHFAGQIGKFQQNWRKSIANATLMGIPCGAMSSALNYYDAYRCEGLPASLLQAQRDFFGAHTYQRLDAPAGQKYHIEWSDPARPEVRIS